MLDIKFIRENKDQVQEAINNKGLSEDVDLVKLLELDSKLRDINIELDDVRRNRNEINEKIKTTENDEERNEYISQTSELKPKEKELEDTLSDLKEEFSDILLKIPNVTSSKMPVGKDENDNVVIRKWGEIKEFEFEIKDHVDLGKALDIIDVEKSGEISGSRYYYLKNEAVLMQFGLINLVLKTLGDENIIKELANKVGNPYSKTFSPILPPVMMKSEVMKKMDRLDPIDDRFQTKIDGLMLVGSAEHTLGPYHMNESFQYEELPIRYIGYSTAFRREAGSYGKDVRGILRAHQFDKLEIETFVPEEIGDVEQDLIVAIQEYLVQQLEIPYQLIQICTGDTGKPDYNQYDIECWIPSQDKYRETHTSDYMTDYQARRLNIKYTDKEGEKKFVHMNDATAFAIGRILIAILENNQLKDGSVKVPKVLQDYVGKDIIEPK